jgi:hypothetical protein
MAKTGGWCKKLMDKAKRNALKAKCGNETSIMSYCQKARPLTARSLDRKNIKDKPLPKGPTYPKKGYMPLPRKVTEASVDPVRVALKALDIISR